MKTRGFRRDLLAPPWLRVHWLTLGGVGGVHVSALQSACDRSLECMSVLLNQLPTRMPDMGDDMGAIQPEKQPVRLAVESLRQPGQSSAMRAPRQLHDSVSDRSRYTAKRSVVSVMSQKWQLYLSNAWQF